MRGIAALLLVCAACAHGGQKPQPAAGDAGAERQRLFELPAGILHAEAREKVLLVTIILVGSSEPVPSGNLFYFWDVAYLFFIGDRDRLAQ